MLDLLVQQLLGRCLWYFDCLIAVLVQLIIGQLIDFTFKRCRVLRVSVYKHQTKSNLQMTRKKVHACMPRNQRMKIRQRAIPTEDKDFQ